MTEGRFPGLPIPSPVGSISIGFCSLQLLGLPISGLSQDGLHQVAPASKLELTQGP